MLEPLSLLTQRLRGLDTKNLFAGVMHETMRLQPVIQIGLRKEVEPPPVLSRVEMCRCSRSRRKFALYVIKKVTVLAMMDVPLMRKLLRNSYVRHSLRCGQSQARGLRLSPVGADQLQGRFGQIEETSPIRLLLRLQDRPVLLEITKVLFRRDGTIPCRL